MKDYVIDFFTYFGCTLEEQDQTLTVKLTPELTQHFGKPELHLVFRPEHAGKDAELATYGSYITSRMYDIVKQLGKRVAITLPKKYLQTKKSQTSSVDQEKISLIPDHGSISRRRSHEVTKTESYLTFRIAYYSNEKTEELFTVCVDMEGNVLVDTHFPYSPDLFHEAEVRRFPYSRKQMQQIYETCLNVVERYAEQQANGYQRQLAEHYHQDVLRLEGYYQQMIAEIPELTSNRQEQAQHLQQEYKTKTAEELKKCQIQVSIEPVSFCVVTIPFRRDRYTLESAKSHPEQENPTVEVLRNLFSGQMLFPRCPSCEQEMNAIGICDAKFHVVCQACVKTCSRCGMHVCPDCGITQCADCGAYVCPECSVQCHLCGKRLCTEHTLGCPECRTHFCFHCGAACEECGRFVGNIHLIECDLSHKTVCFDCLVTCPCCDRHVGQSQAHTCTFCGQHICRECTFRCDVCGEQMCVHHIRECELSGQMVCPRHVGVCEHCSRHVSTPHLHACDVCGKQLCSQCALQCHDCGVFFCEDHREELLACPMCGKTYCHLCYSGQGICSSCQKNQAGS